MLIDYINNLNNNYSHSQVIKLRLSTRWTWTSSTCRWTKTMIKSTLIKLKISQVLTLHNLLSQTMKIILCSQIPLWTSFRTQSRVTNKCTIKTNSRTKVNKNSYMKRACQSSMKKVKPESINHNRMNNMQHRFSSSNRILKIIDPKCIKNSLMGRGVLSKSIKV